MPLNLEKLERPALWAFVLTAALAVCFLGLHGPIRKPSGKSSQGTGHIEPAAAPIPGTIGTAVLYGDSPETTPQPDTGLTSWINRRFPDSREMDRREIPATHGGLNERLVLLQTHFKYPMIRVSEKFHRNPVTSQETLVTRTAMVADHVLLRPKDPAGNTRLDSLLKDEGMDSFKTLYRDTVQLVRLPSASLDAVPDAVKSLSSQKQLVAYAEPDFVYFHEAMPNDPSFSNQWGLHYTSYPNSDINAPEGWDLRTSAAQVVVGVIDGGARYTHQDLAANMWHNPGEIPGNGVDDEGNGLIDDVYGADFYADDADPNDENGHGTHVAGIIGAAGNNGIGITGVAWQAQIMAVRFLDANGTGVASDAVQAIQYAVAEGALVLNNSWGGDSFSQTLKDAILNARSQDIPFVAAAGNNARNTDTTPIYPACFDLDNILSVGSTSFSSYFSYFSNYGQTSVDVLAPGDGIYSLGKASDTDYTTKNGTSQAAALVSGMVALLKAEFPGQNTTWLLQRISNSSISYPAIENKTRTDGRVDLYNALAGITRTPVSIVTEPSTPLVYTGNDLTLTVSVQGGGPFRYQWYFNNTALTGQTAATLTLNGITSANSGTYHVVITSLTGTATSQPVTITVQNSSPLVSLQPTDVVALEGQRVSLTAGARGSFPMNLQWEFNGVAIPGATASTLVLPSVQSSHVGEYTLLATNALGSQRTAKAKLTLRHHFLEFWALTHPKPSLAIHNNVAFVNNLFVAVGEAGAISTSADGTSWSACTPATASSLLAVAYGSGRYVAVGADGIIVTSTDAVTWTTTSSGTSQEISDIVFADNRFVAVSGNYALVSTDGLAWSSRLIGNKTYHRIAYGAGSFVALGDADDYNIYISRSSDGSTWNAAPPFVSDSYNLLWASLVYANGIFWLGDGSKVYTSPDGSAWTLYKYLPDNKRLLPVGDTLYMLYGSQYYQVGSYNPDNIWGQPKVLYSSPNRFAAWRGLAWGNGRLVVVGGAILLSTDGNAFNLVSHFTTDLLVGTAYGNGEFLSATREGKIFGSPDGTHWTPRASITLPLGTWFNSITYGNGRYVIVSNITNNTGKVWTSTDGLSWSPSTYAANINSWSAAVVFHGGYFFATTDALRATNHINTLRSVDGTTWTPVPIPVDSLAYGNGRWIRTYNYYGSYVSTSTDATSWQEIKLPADYGESGSAAAWGNGKFLIITASNKALFSPDGTSWTALETYGLSGKITNLAFHDGLFVAVGEYSGLYISLDGISWVAKSNSDYRYLTPGDTAFLAHSGPYHPLSILQAKKFSALSTNAIGQGTVHVQPDRSLFQSGEAVDVDAVPATGYAFAGWSGSVQGQDSSISLTMTGDFTLNARFKPFSLSWRQRYFSAVEIAAGLSESWVDADGDGWDNYMEYKLAMNPRSHLLTPACSLEMGTSGHQFILDFTFRRTKNDSTLLYLPEASSDLINWSTTTTTQLGNPVDNGDGTETVKVREMVPNNIKSRFLRLRVEEQ